MYSLKARRKPSHNCAGFRKTARRRLRAEWLKEDCGFWVSREPGFRKRSCRSRNATSISNLWVWWDWKTPCATSVPAAIQECHTAGIRVVMITGDYPATAHSIARQIGLKESDVFARVLPEQKLDIVEAFKARGEIVAMTGDGVNDAPALKAAHIGIAMGGRGTDVAREAASLVLLDDDFSSIVEAVRLGRRIYDNLQKAMTYVFAIHLPIAGLSLLPVFFGLPLILMPLHIVFLELVIDPACSTAFESEPEHPQIMKRPPRDPRSRLFDRRMIMSAIFQGLVLFAMALGAFVISLYRGQGEVDARAISFTTLVLGNLALIWANRSRTRTIPEMLWSRNVPLWAVTTGALTLLAVVLYVPSIRDLFQFSTLHPNDIAICVLLALASITGLEVAKLLRRKTDETFRSTVKCWDIPTFDSRCLIHRVESLQLLKYIPRPQVREAKKVGHLRFKLFVAAIRKRSGRRVALLQRVFQSCFMDLLVFVQNFLLEPTAASTGKFCGSPERFEINRLQFWNREGHPGKNVRLDVVENRPVQRIEALTPVPGNELRLAAVFKTVKVKVVHTPVAEQAVLFREIVFDSDVSHELGQIQVP
jgi:soluble P-type ATPase